MAGRTKFDHLKAKTLAKPGAREAIDERKAEVRKELSLAELRRAREFTQAQLATALETTQPAISRIERQADLYLSTLRSYVEAIGGRLELHAVFPDAVVPIEALESLGQDARPQESGAGPRARRAKKA